MRIGFAGIGGGNASVLAFGIGGLWFRNHDGLVGGSSYSRSVSGVQIFSYWEALLIRLRARYDDADEFGDSGTAGSGITGGSFEDDRVE